MRRTILRLAPSSLSNTRVRTRSPPVHVSKPAWDDPTVKTEPGQHVVSLCKQHEISGPQELRSLKGVNLGKNPYHIGVSHSQQHCLLHQSMRYFDKVEHPFTRALLDIYIEKKKEPLWWSGFAYGASPFPNKMASRRIAHALRDALVAAGYDRFGRRVLVDGESSVIADLYGTLRVVSTDSPAVCNAKFADLLECAKQIVFSAEMKLRRDKNGVHLERQQRQHYPRTHGTQQGPRRQSNNQRVRRAY